MSVIKTLPLFWLSGVISVEVRVEKVFPVGVVQFPGNKFTFDFQVKVRLPDVSVHCATHYQVSFYFFIVAATQRFILV